LQLQSQPVLATLLTLLTSASGYDAALARSVQLYNEAEWDAALRELTVAEKLAADDAERAKVWLHQGVIHANVPNAEAAEAAWRRALELDAKQHLPLPVSPRVKALFEKVRGTVKEKPVLVPQEDQRRAEALALMRPPSKFPVVPVVCLGAALAAGGVGLGFAFAASSTYGAARSATSEAERLALSQRAWTQSLVGNIAFVTAGVAALAALITFIVLD
jgi:tetratricopeptide (TPR) repeat protein